MSDLKRDTAEMAVPSVSVVQPKAGAPQQEIILPGTIQAYAEAPIYARTSGYLKRRLVEMGARVKANQLLAEIDAPELEQQLQQAKADLATAEANARLAQITADRYQDLVNTDSVSKQDADNAVGALEARKTAVQSARHNVQRLEQLQSFTRIYAPFDGIITARNTDVGALIDPGAGGGPARSLFNIASTDKLRVFVNVPQPYSRAAQLGLKTDLTLSEFPGRRFTGTLVRTAGAIDLSSRTLLVEIEVDNRAGELLPGAYAQVHLSLPSPAAALVVPVNALLFRADGLRLAVVREGDRITMVPVTIGRDFGTEAEILTGLSGGERIVASPPDSLTDGQVVRIVAAAPSEGGKGAAR
jgi:RND family efflux transporter MFP subunit